MSEARPTGGNLNDRDVWAHLAEHREALEILVEEDTPFAERAERLLDRLEAEGY